ncbi:MAG TPA: CvpA family protein [Bacteroidota bacterium]|nr:CvpA family protein [Bacteroidota bacterium]
MLLDMLLGVPVIFTSVLGFRDGIVRKLVAIGSMVVALVVGQLFMRDVGQLLTSLLDVPPSEAPMKGFLTIFFVIVFLQGLIYRLAADGYKIGGIADRVGGCALGFGEGILFASAMLMIFAMEGAPSRATARDSRLYKPVVNIAPEIVDFLVNFGPESKDAMKGLEKQGVESPGDAFKSRFKALGDTASTGRSSTQ